MIRSSSAIRDSDTWKRCERCARWLIASPAVLAFAPRRTGSPPTPQHVKPKINVAVVQDGSVPFDAKATTKKVCRLIAEASRHGAELAVFPEAFLGTYPKGLTFDAPIGRRLPEGREDFLRYYN